jgi:parallel beta-helix repeat protein
MMYTPMDNTRSRKNFTAACGLSALLLAACGGSDQGLTSTQEEPSGPSASSIQAAPLSAKADPSPDAPAAAAANAFTVATDSPQASAAKYAAAATDVPDVLFFVDPAGNDSWSGTLSAPNATSTDGPKRTPAGVQNAVRIKLGAMKAGAVARAPIRVRFAAGEYTLTSPWMFSPADSGTATAPVVYEAVLPGSVLITGGTSLGTQKALAAGQRLVFTAPSSYTASQMSGGGQLFINGRRATLARQPNAGGYWFVKAAIPLSSEPAGQTGREAFTPYSNSVAWLNSLSSSDRTRAIIPVFQSWTTGFHRFNDVSVPTGAVRVKPRTTWAFRNFGAHQRYYVENVTAAFDAPGEWLWDASGVQYLATTAEAGSTLTATMPVLPTLVMVQGLITTNTYVEHLQLRGLKFAYTRHQLPPTGLVDTQAASGVGAAIQVEGARSLVIDGCHISKVAGYGIWLRDSVRATTLSNNTITDVGAGGIRVGMLTETRAASVATGANTLTNNRISETGKIFPSAVGVWIGQSFDNVVSNNLIHSTTYSGISVGWALGYGTATSGRNTIARNLLVNIGQGVMSDLGGIYTLSVSPGTTVAGNVIREVRGYTGYGAGAWGLYNDEGSSQITMNGNIVIGSDAGGHHLHYGRSNTLAGNLFAGGDKAEFTITRTDPLLTKFTVSTNQILPGIIQPFAGYATAPDALYSGNTIASTAGGVAVNTAKCGTGCTKRAMSLVSGSNPRSFTWTGAVPSVNSAFLATAAAAGPTNLTAAELPTVATTRPPLVFAPAN